jgi:hypothetical protein
VSLAKRHTTERRADPIDAINVSSRRNKRKLLKNLRRMGDMRQTWHTRKMYQTVTA